MFLWPRAVIAASLTLLATSAAPMSVDQATGYWFVEAKNIRLTDAARHEATGGIIALYPRAVDAQTLAIPGGEPFADLHVSLVYFGDDVGGVAANELPQVLHDLAAAHPHPIEAHVFGHAIFDLNDGQFDTAAVYLVGDSPTWRHFANRCWSPPNNVSGYLPNTSRGYRTSRRATGRRTPLSPTRVRSSSTVSGSVGPATQRTSRWEILEYVVEQSSPSI